METWYVMEDGSFGDPREIAPDAKGSLRHKDGRAVAYASHGPRSRSVDAAEERPKAVAGKKPAADARAAPVAAKEMKPEEPKAAYQTRDVKAG